VYGITFLVWTDIEGRCARDGIDIDDLLAAPAYESVGVFLSYAIDDATTALGGNRATARDEVMAWLRGERDGVAGVATEEPDPETWGLMPEHQAGLLNAMGSFNAPAGVG
jgi:hypothetical protein